MATFSAYMDILPDPNNKIGAAGQPLSTGTAGPGYSSVALTADQKTITSRTNSNRISARAIAGHKWNIDIGYNPMTQEQFMPIYNFLLHRNGPLNPFYVSLPQYRTPQNSTFSTTDARYPLCRDAAELQRRRTNAALLRSAPPAQLADALDRVCQRCRRRPRSGEQRPTRKASLSVSSWLPF